MTKLVLEKADGIEDGRTIVATYVARGERSDERCDGCDEVVHTIRFEDASPIDRAIHLCGECVLTGDEEGEFILKIVRSGKHCECPLNGEPCCACGRVDCEAPAEEATRHADDRR